MLDDARDVIRNTQTLPDWYADWAQRRNPAGKCGIKALRPVINLTGTVLHTNLGRALRGARSIEGGNAGDARAGDAGIRFGWRRAGASRPGAGDAVMPYHRGGGRLYRQ